MTGAAEREVRRSLARVRRALDRAGRELELIETTMRDAEGGDFPADVFEDAAQHLHAVGEFIDEQAERLEAKILEAGGVEPGRVQRGADRPRTEDR